MRTKLLIEQHFHGCFGIDFNKASVDDVLYLSKEILKYGIGGIFPTIVTDSVENTKKAISVIKEAALKQSDDMARILGIHLEGIFINPQKKGIHNPEHFLPLTVENFKNLADNYFDIIKIVTYAPELDSGNFFAEFLNKNNIKAHAGHTLATDKGGACATTHHFNAMPNISHRGKNLALDCLFDDKIHCEIIADTIHVSKNMLKLFFKIKNPSKIIMISDSLPAAHCNSEITFCGKKINKNGKDENGTLAGSVMLLDEIALQAIQKNIITAEMVENFAYYNPVNYLGIKENDL